MVDSTSTVNLHEEESLIQSDNKHTPNIWEKENESHSLHGRSVPQPFSNRKADSIEQSNWIQIERNEENGRNQTFVSLHPGAAHCGARLPAGLPHSLHLFRGPLLHS